MSPTSSRLGPALTLVGLLALAGRSASPPPRDEGELAPGRLADTGLYADATLTRVAADNLPYVPQYPLWTDGATKRRWIHLPAGTAIDATDPDAWVFPVGTKLWKEFSFGRRVETRYLERAPSGRWVYAAYVWDVDGRDARLAPERGVPAACESAPGVPHDVPGRYDCLACHEGQPTPVLGFGALQLSTDRDPLALHAEPPPPDALDLATLVRRGLVRGLDPRLLERPPRIAAASARERAALGYLHSNCAACHNARGPLAPLGLDLEATLARPAAALATTRGRPGARPLPGVGTLARLSPGEPQASLLVRRMASRSPLVQMPPLGTHAVDAQALELLEGWVRDELAPAPAATPGDDLLSRL